MAGVEVVDRDPIEARAEILFHLPHHVPREAMEIGQTIAVLGNHDEAELVAVLAPLLDEGPAIHPLVIRSIELTSPAVAGRPIALEVVEMRMGSSAADLQPDDPCLDHDTAHTLARVPLPRRQLQSIGRGLAPTDPRATTFFGTRRPRRTSVLAARPSRRQGASIGLHGSLHDLREERLRPPRAASSVTDAAGAGAEI
ncbi:hypothetical protein [Bradyrhizobium sp. CCBAU 51627]|uniref:hypothetical protein n=1 Tax=Bradyrhizobium sp. CCBAU 51627 TaxID=1325088 RepID=UPI002304D554|nr:hypothetical protein [Bradyrhizobium sp. CCBAU 51627]